MMPSDTVLIDTDSSFDVTYVKIDLSVRPDTEYLAGSVLIRATAHNLRTDRTIQLSLRQQLHVDSVFNDGVPIVWDHLYDKLFLTLHTGYATGGLFDVTIYYHGFSTDPDRRGFIHTWQNWLMTGIPISWSGGEAYSSKTWWPCKDNPADKIDSADLIFTCPKLYSVASEGILEKVTEHDTSHTFWWHESYPIDHYLIAFCCTQFDSSIHWHHWADGDSMKIENFLFPGSADTLGQQALEIDTILNLYERWFGPYPFRREKYGIAQWHGGGMENQTLSFCNDAGSDLVAHETAHQWFGDGITCMTWNDCWLNEGFATYVTDLWDLDQHGRIYFDTADILNQEKEATKLPGGFVHTPDSVLDRDVLNVRLVYSKAGLVLHMLRFVLGSDSAFFRAVREYMTGPLRYGVAGADDFRTSIERSSGKDLKWFFDEWIYGEGYPIYTVAWNTQDSLHPAVAISQTASTRTTPLFIMPIELRFQGNGLDTTVQVWNDRPLEPYSFTFPKPVTVLTFDPNNWLLDGELPRTLSVQSFNTPSSSSLTVRPAMNGYEIQFSLAEPANMSFEVYDVLGRQVSRIESGMTDPGMHSIAWHPSLLPAGVYFFRMIASGAPVATTHVVIK